MDIIGVEYQCLPPPMGVGYEKENRMKNEDEEDVYCIDIIRQIQAVQSALNKVSTAILENHLNSCVTTAIRGQDASERERVLKEITDVFETATKV